MEAPEGIEIVRGGHLVRRGFGFPDVDGDGEIRVDVSRTIALESRRDLVRPLARKAETVDERALARGAKDARARVPGLRLARDGADLDEAETKLMPGCDRARVLVESGGEAERVPEAEPPELDGILDRGDSEAEELRDRPARKEREKPLVHAFGVEAKERWAKDPVVDHRASLNPCAGERGRGRWRQRTR